MLLNYPPSSNAGKTSRSNRTSSQVIEPILGKEFIFIDLVPVIPKENLQKDAQMIKYAKIPEITENYRQRLVCVLELQELIGVSSTLVIGGKSAQSALTTLPHNVVLKESGSIIWNFTDFLKTYAVLSNHLSAGMMSGMNRAQCDMIRGCLKMCSAVQMTVKSKVPIEDYAKFLTKIDKELEEKAAANSKWINQTFGENAVERAKEKINSIVYCDLAYTKLLVEFLFKTNIDKEKLFSLCFGRVIAEKHYLGFNEVFSNYGLPNAVRLLSTNSFCAAVDKLLPHLAALKTELGVEPAVRLLSTGSFCAAIETLSPHLATLKTELGVEPAVRLLSTNSFCASIDKLLSHLTEIRKDFDAEEAVKLFFSGSFCAHIDTLVSRLPGLKRILGLDGILVIFSNNAIPSMNDKQWLEFMKFIAVAKKEHVITYANKKSVVSLLKRVGWDVVLTVYQLPGTSKTRDGFSKAIKAYIANLQ